MKKVLFLAFTTLICVGAWAQEPQVQRTEQVYCEIVGTKGPMSSKVTVEIDMGQNASVWHDHRIVGDDGKPIKFNSMMDALNYMGDRGWEFVQAYAITSGNSHVYHFLLTKKVAEGETGTEGLQTKRQFKEANEQ